MNSNALEKARRTPLEGEERLLREDATVLVQMVLNAIEEVEFAQRGMAPVYDRKRGFQTIPGLVSYPSEPMMAPPGEQQDEKERVYFHVGAWEGYDQITHVFPGTRTLRISRQKSRKNDIETFWFVMEPKNRNIDANEQAGYFSIQFGRDTATGEIRYLRVRHPMMMSWPTPEEPLFVDDPLILKSGPSAPDGARRFLPFHITVGEDPDKPEARTARPNETVTARAIAELWPTLFPKLRNELEAAIANLNRVLPQPECKKLPKFEPREREDAQALAMFLEDGGANLVEEISDPAQLSQEQQENLQTAARNFCRQRTRQERPPNLAEAFEIVRNNGFIVCRCRGIVFMIESFAQPGMDKNDLVKPIQRDPFAATIAGAHQFAETGNVNREGPNPAEIAQLIRFFAAQTGRACGVISADNVRAYQITSRGGLPREVIDAVMEQIGQQLGLRARLPFTVEHRLTAALPGHENMTNGTTFEWVQDWTHVKPGDARGIIVGGRSLGAVSLADDHDSRYGNVDFRVVVELGVDKDRTVEVARDPETTSYDKALS